MTEEITPFVPKNPDEAAKRLLNQAKNKLDSLVEQAGLGSPDEPFNFRTQEDFSSVELVSKWEGLLKELSTPVFIENEKKQSYVDGSLLILEFNENVARDYLVEHYKDIMALATLKEKQEYIFINKKLILCVRRLKSLVNNNSK